MPSNFKKTLETTKISELRMRSPVLVPLGTSLQETLKRMKTHRRGCAIIVSDKEIFGIFTERDLLTRGLSDDSNLDKAIDEFMTQNPSCLTKNSSIAEAIHEMSDLDHRHIPILDESKKILGFISVRDVLDYLADQFPYEVYSLPPDPYQHNTAPEGA